MSVSNFSFAPSLRAANLLMHKAAGERLQDRPVISNWAALLNYVKLKLRYEKAEQARVHVLDRTATLIADEVVGRGTLDHAAGP